MNNPGNPIIMCEKCNVQFNRESSYSRHLQSDKHKMDKTEYKEKLRQQGLTSILNGEDNEHFILEVLKIFDFENVVHLGHTANRFDIFVKFRDEEFYRGLQIKTLTHCSENNNYTINSNRSGYENDTLIIAVSNDKTRYALLFYSEMMGKKKFNISPTCNANNLFENFDIFYLTLLIYVRRSTVVTNFNDYLQESQRQEAESINRFKKISESLNISFQQNSTNSNEIDAIVNGRNVQFKSSNTKRHYMYKFHLDRKTNGIVRPYSINDNVDFFIFEIVNEKYHNGFYIIPKESLINTGYVSGVNTAGKLAIHLAPFDYDRHHWTLNFLNRFDQLVSNAIVSTVHNRFHKICIDMGFLCKFGWGNKFESINSMKVRYIKHTVYNKTSCRFDLRIYQNSQRNQIHVGDNYKFVIFDFGDLYPDQFCIIPIDIMIQHGYISTEISKGKPTITISFIGMKADEWTNYYMNNLELLHSH